MLPTPKKLCLLAFILLLTGCGGGSSSQVVTPTITLVTPIATTIAAGSSLQLRAVVANTNNTTVLWYVNNIPGGNSIVGTITPQGLYTAPDMPTANGSVVISASPQAYPAAATSVTIGITFSNASLNGSFVFVLNGTQSGSPWAAVGSFTAGNGIISNGVEDINGPAGVSQALAFNGSYFIDASGIGIATFSSSQGSVNLSFTLNTQGQAVLMRTDAGTAASGNFYPQQSTALALTSLNSPYVFSLSGTDASGKPLSTIGTFVTNGTSTLTYAEEDLNSGGSTANQPFSGSYTIGSGARGTASFTDSTGTRSYSFYIVSPGQLQFLETDSQGDLSGTVFQQQSITSSTTLAGNYVFYVSGSNGAAVYATAGGFATNTTTGGNINAGTSDINIGGSVATNNTLTGSFTYGDFGRGTITLGGASGSNNYVFYQITPTSAFLLSTDSGINATGLLFFQSGGYSAAALNGNYTLSSASPAGATPAVSVGLLTLNGLGAIAGFEDNNNGTASGQLSVTGTYSVTASTTTTSTRGVMTLTANGGASTNFVFYPISGGSVILLGESGAPIIGLLVSQY